MKKLTLVFLTFCFFACYGLLSIYAQTEQYAKAKIYTDDAGLAQLHQLGIAVDHGEYKKNTYFISDFSFSELTQIQQAGFHYDIIAADAAQYYADRNQQNNYTKKSASSCQSLDLDALYPVPQDFEYGAMAGFFTYQEMLQHLDHMLAKYPHLISQRDTIGDIRTHDGNVVFYVKVSDNPNEKEEEPEVLYTALHHAREVQSLTQMIYYLYYLLENYETDDYVRYLVDHTEMYFVPCVNPDGYIFNEQTDPDGYTFWRKNRRNNGAGVFGVDLNRNYGVAWGINDEGSSPDSTSNVYRGPSPFSEPETQALKQLCEAHQFQVALNYHTHSNVLIHPWGYADSLTVDQPIFAALGRLFTEQNNYPAGTGQQVIGYLANGNSDDWMYGEQTTKNKIFTFTPEVGSSQDGFWPERDRIIPLAQENVWANLNAATVLLDYAQPTASSITVMEANKVAITVEVTGLGLSNSGVFTVSIAALNEEVTLSEPQVIDAIPFGEKVTLLFEATVAPATPELHYQVTVSNENGGTFTKTFQKYLGQQAVVYQEPADHLNNWDTFQWGISTKQFVSGNSSITDSPNENYASNTQAVLTLEESIDLTNALHAELQFWAKWDIEAQYDYVQLLAFDASDQVRIPLCGNYTKLGSWVQRENEPIYDGKQEDWVLETVDLSDWIGKEIRLEFVLDSDNYTEADGFYFDDLVVNKVVDEVLTVENIGLNNPTLATLSVTQPNPVTKIANINYQLPTHLQSKAINMVVYNAIGQTVIHQPIDCCTPIGTIQLAVAHLQSGMYYYHLVQEGEKTPISETQRMVVVK